MSSAPAPAAGNALTHESMWRHMRLLVDRAFVALEKDGQSTSASTSSSICSAPSRGMVLLQQPDGTMRVVNARGPKRALAAEEREEMSRTIVRRALEQDECVVWDPAAAPVDERELLMLQHRGRARRSAARRARRSRPASSTSTSAIRSCRRRTSRRVLHDRGRPVRRPPRAARARRGRIASCCARSAPSSSRAGRRPARRAARRAEHGRHPAGGRARRSRASHPSSSSASPARERRCSPTRSPRRAGGGPSCAPPWARATTRTRSPRSSSATSRGVVVGRHGQARRPRGVRERRHPHPRRDPQPAASRAADPPRLHRVRDLPPARLRGRGAQARARADHRRHERRRARGDQGAALPAGPLLPARGRHDRPAAAARAAR